jgi:hypothetical protein
MRTVALLLAAFGTWKVDVARSTFAGDTAEELDRADRAAREGEVHAGQGRRTAAPSLPFDPVPRRRAAAIADFGVPESSRRGERTAVPLDPGCAPAGVDPIRPEIILPPKEMVLEITEQHVTDAAPSGAWF